MEVAATRKERAVVVVQGHTQGHVGSETPLLLPISLIKRRGRGSAQYAPRVERQVRAPRRVRGSNPLLRADRLAPSCRSLVIDSGAGLEASEQAAALAVRARGALAFRLAPLDLDAVGVVGLVRRRRRRRRRRWRRGAPDQFKVELTASVCGAAALQLGGGAEPRAYGLADGLGLGEGLVPCAPAPARTRLAAAEAAAAARAAAARAAAAG